jgi:hypothetical protein
VLGQSSAPFSSGSTTCFRVVPLRTYRRVTQSGVPQLVIEQPTALRADALDLVQLESSCITIRLQLPIGQQLGFVQVEAGKRVDQLRYAGC